MERETKKLKKMLEKKLAKIEEGERKVGAEFALPEDFEREFTMTWLQLLSFFLIISFLSIYILSYIADRWMGVESDFAGFHSFINMQVSFILSDWQLTMSIILILLLTVGWYLMLFVSVLVIHVNVTVGAKIKRRKSILIRYGIAEYFLSLIIAHFVFSYEFKNIMLWFSAIFVFALVFSVSIALFNLSERRLKDPRSIIEQWKEVIPRTDATEPELKNRYILIISVIIMFLASIIILFPLYVEIWELIHSDLVIAIFFYFTINITLLWRFWRFIGVLLTYLPQKIVKTTVKKKVNKFRFLILVFIFSMLLYKNLPIFQDWFGLDDLQVQMLALLLSILTTILSWYITRRLGSG